jgi:hypothetical protein
MSLYRSAQAAVRRRLGALQVETARTIQQSLSTFSQEIARSLSSAGSVDILRARVATQRIIADASRRLQKKIELAVRDQRDVAFREVQEIMTKAQLAAAEAVGVRGAVMGAIRTPPISMIGAFEGLGSAQTWRTLIQNSVRRSAIEANAIVSRALLEGMGPDELARRLRLYVTGSEPFQEAFGDKVDLRRVPAALRGQAGQMQYNAERIAFSEYQAARHEAEVQAWIADPLVESVQWTLSPKRGTQVTPDECDLLATTDFYGMGAGIFPVDKVPPNPHPWCRCELLPVTRPTDEMRRAKPSPDRKLSASQAGFPFDRPISPAQADRARQAAEAAVRWGEETVTTRNKLARVIRSENLNGIPVGSVDPETGRMVAQPVGDLDEILRRATDTLPRFESAINKATKGTQSHINGIRVKTKDSALRKITDQKRSADSLQDYLGARVALDTIEEAEKVVASIERQGWRVLENEEFFNAPKFGYRARHVNFLSPDGRVSVELQLAPREVQALQEEAHHYYEIARDPKYPAAEREAAGRKSVELFEKGWQEYIDRTQRQKLAWLATDQEFGSAFMARWEVRATEQYMESDVAALKKQMKKWVTEGKGKLQEGSAALQHARTDMFKGTGLSENSIHAYDSLWDDGWISTSAGSEAAVLKVAARAAWGDDMLVSLDPKKVEQYLEKTREFMSQGWHGMTIEDVANLMRTERAMNVTLLRDLGFKTVKLYRGVGVGYFQEQGFEVPAVGSTQKLAMKNLSSWTTDLKTAKGFGDVVYEIEVPIENVVSSYLTRARYYEQEFVIAGKPTQAKAVYVSNTLRPYIGKVPK